MYTTQEPAIVAGTFIYPMNGFGFKTLFGSEPNKEILIDLLNELLQGRKVITDLTYNKNESRAPQKEFRGSVFDLTCTDQGGAKFLIEMQRVHQPYFRDRAVYYTSSMIHEHWSQGIEKLDFDPPEVFFIGLMDFEFNDHRPSNYLNRMRFYNAATDKVFHEKLEFIFIELSNFDKSEAELETNLDQWLFALKNISKLGEIPTHLTKPIFQKMFKIAEVANLSKDDLSSYERSLKTQWDEYFIWESAKKEAKEAGLKEGKELRLKEVEAELHADQEKAIINLLKLDLPIRQIADILNVSDPFVQQVKEKHS